MFLGYFEKDNIQVKTAAVVATLGIFLFQHLVTLIKVT